MPIIIGSRKSHLAQVQAKKVNAVFKKKHPNLETELYFRPSFGDLNLDMDLSKTNQKGVFTQDFLELLNSGDCDMVVHSWKDLPIEDTETTKIVSTLEREDSRDLFLIKRSALKKKKWIVLTSSPRREFNLQALFSHLSDKEQEIDFAPIRGNIPTRFEKFLKDENADGFCVALAAVKRLKDFKDFNDENPGMWEKLNKLCAWCIMPESYCPSAAAQGALAIEVSRSNEMVTKAVSEISHQSVFDAVVKERQILKGHGGGCHLAVGATVVPHSLGELTFTAGCVKGESFRSIGFKPHKAYPSKVEDSKIWISSEHVKATRTEVAVPNLGDKKKAFVASKFSGVSKIQDQITDGDVLFTSGLKTWKKLFSAGLWVNGSLDNLGAENFETDVLSEGFENIWFTRTGVTGPEGFKTVPTYDLETSLDSKSFEDKDYFIWMSGELLRDCLEKHPELKAKSHFLGMGRSRDVLKHQIFSNVEVWPFYNLEQIKEDLIS